MQGDGTAQLLCRSAASQAAVCAILTTQLQLHCMPLTLKATQAEKAPEDSLMLQVPRPSRTVRGAPVALKAAVWIVLLATPQRHSHADEVMCS